MRENAQGGARPMRGVASRLRLRSLHALPPFGKAQFGWRVCLAITLWRANLLSGTQAVGVCLRRPPRSVYVDYHLAVTTVS